MSPQMYGWLWFIIKEIVIIRYVILVLLQRTEPIVQNNLLSIPIDQIGQITMTEL